MKIIYRAKEVTEKEMLEILINNTKKRLKQMDEK